jgi:hypothetical protein
LERGEQQAMINEEDKKPVEVDMESIFLLRSEFSFNSWFVGCDFRMVVVLITDWNLSCWAGVVSHERDDTFGIDTKASVQIRRRYRWSGATRVGRFRMVLKIVPQSLCRFVYSPLSQRMKLPYTKLNLSRAAPYKRA